MAETKFLDNVGLTHLFEKINAKFSKLGHKHTKADITDFAHNHNDLYYGKTDVDSKLSGKANTSHNHDDRYYTESEINAKLDAETKARTDADSELDTAYKAADTAIGDRIDNAETEIAGIIQLGYQLAGELESESKGRVENDNYLQSSINEKADLSALLREVNYRKAADTSIGTRIDNAMAEISANSADLTGIRGLTYGKGGQVFLENENGAYSSPALDEISHEISDLQSEDWYKFAESPDTHTFLKEDYDKMLSRWPKCYMLLNVTNGQGKIIRPVFWPVRRTDTHAYLRAVVQTTNNNITGFMLAEVRVGLNEDGSVNVSTKATFIPLATWETLTKKPFSTIGSGLKVVDNALTVDASAHNHNDLYYQKSEVDGKLSGKAAVSHKHVAADITSVNASAISGVIASANLPSFVDDVIEGYLNGGKFYKDKKTDGTYATEITAETGKIYVNLNDSKTYRWSGSAYVVISETIALGETSSTAYRGDRGKIAYDHSQVTSGNPHKVTKSDVGLGNVDNTADSVKSVKHATSADSASTAASATKAIQDSAGQQINTTYINKVNKSGDTMAGRLTAPEVAATNYFVTPTMVGEGDDTKYFHRIDFGYASHDHVDFYEYGGTWNFYKNRDMKGAKDTRILVASIQPDGFHGDVKGQAESAITATRLSSSAGSATQPVYFLDGKPVATTYTLEKSVPSNAVFTDTNTWIALKGATTSAAGSAGYVAAPAAGQQGFFLRGDGAWAAISKSTVGLGNVDNTADSNKSVKYAASAGSASSATKASTADSATKATQDSAGNNINTTYIKNLSVSGRVITFTKGDGTTGTITTQDTNTTYNAITNDEIDAVFASVFG